MMMMIIYDDAEAASTKMSRKNNMKSSTCHIRTTRLGLALSQLMSKQISLGKRMPNALFDEG
eukprot:5605885-Amphidinium_carterae.1